MSNSPEEDVQAEPPALDDGEGYDEMAGEEVEPDHDLDVETFEEEDEE